MHAALSGAPMAGLHVASVLRKGQKGDMFAPIRGSSGRSQVQRNRVQPEETAMSKSHVVAFACILTLLGSVRGAEAADYTCPAASAVTCVPEQKTIGAWRDNGAMMTGNTFAPNSSCANVINLPNGMKRLLCCYTKCGVFLQDVQASQCTKTSASQFTCN
jgi:hypothetical protein